MKCRRAAMDSEVVKYELGQGLEDGFERLSDIVIKGWIITDNLVETEGEGGDIICPYISHRRGRTFINVGDYIVIDADGTKHVCGGDKIFQRYIPLEEEK